MSEIILKGEIHTSKSDLEEERDLLIEGTDALVLEGQAHEAEYSFLRSWYATAMHIIGLIFFETLYTDHGVLTDIAEAQDAEVIATRESDSEIIDNANPIVELLAGVIFYGFFALSVLYGFYTGDKLRGAGLLLVSAVLPVLLLRYHGMNRISESTNRDDIIASKIADAAEKHDRVLAVVGAAHLEGVRSALPEDLEVSEKPPKYSPVSLQHVKEIAKPAFKAFAILFVLYSLILWAMTPFLGNA